MKSVAILESFLRAGNARSVRRARGTSPFLQTFTLELRRYAGLWYEVARTPNAFEDNRPLRRGRRASTCFGATAHYTLRADGSLEVVNRCLRCLVKDPSRTVQDDVFGVARIAPHSCGRKLQVAFGPWYARLLQRALLLGRNNYWIFGVGPLNEAGLYAWALVGNGERDSIFVLAREPSLTAQEEADILSLAEREHLPIDALIYAQEHFGRRASAA